MLDSPTIRFLVLAVCASLFVVCDVLAANWGKNGSILSLVAMILLAPFSYVLFGYLNQKYPLSVISAWVVLALCVSTVFIGIVFFHDQLSLRQGVGVALAVVAISLLVF